MAAVRRAQRHYWMTTGIRQGCDPRRRSTVEHRLPVPAHDVLNAGFFGGDIRVSTLAGTLVADRTLTEYDADAHEYRVPATLHLAWSWPALPMWLIVAEQSATRCTLGLSLRSRRRARYPTRYFHAAHSALAGLELQIADRASIAR
jgi:hypothetical protein